MKRFALLAIAFAFVFAVAGNINNPVAAQDDNVLEYGVTVTGELSDQAFEIEYFFTGAAGDIVIVEMARFDFDSDVDEPAIILLDPDFAVVASEDGFGDVRVAYQLEVDGEYTILATRRDGRAGTSVGQYVLSLDNPPALVAGEPVDASATSEDPTYFVLTEAGDVTLTYTRGTGEFNPAVSVYTADENGVLDEFEPVAVLAGNRLENGVLSLSVFEGEFLIVEVAESTFDFNFDEVAVDFTIGIE